MATFYNVTDRNMTEKTTREAIEAKGLKKAAEIEIAGRYATTYKVGGPNAKIEAVAIFEAPGDDFTGKRI